MVPSVRLPPQRCQLTVPAIGRNPLVRNTLSLSRPCVCLACLACSCSRPISRVVTVRVSPILSYRERVQERVLFYVVKISPPGNSSSRVRTHVLDNSSQVNSIDSR
jgi:hypothetical protein